MSKRYINPFRPTAGAEPPALIGRGSILSDFEAGLEGGVGAPARLMRITGPRGSGKTVLLTELSERAKALGWTTVDVTAGPRLLGELMHELVPSSAVAKMEATAGVGVASGSVEMSVKDPSLRDLMRSRTQAANGLLITIDEVHDAQHDDMQYIASSIQHLIREKTNVALVFAGLPSGVMDLINGKAMTFLRRAVGVELRLIGEAEIGISLRKSFAQTKLTLEGDVMKKAAAATGGYAYLIQLVGFYVWEQANAHRGSSAVVTATDVEDGTAIALEQFHQAVFEPAISGLSLSAMEYLLAMTEDRAASSTQAVAERLGKSQSSASTLRRALLQKQIIQPSARGFVEFAIPFLGDYLKGHREELLARYGIA